VSDLIDYIIITIVMMIIITGRYRSVAQFIRDLKYIVEGRILPSILKAIGNSNRMQKETAIHLSKQLITFLNDILEEKLNLD
jgi:hypothetical protein